MIRTVFRRISVTVLIALAAVCLVCFLPRGEKSARADSDAYSFEFGRYEINYDVESNRLLHVTELMEVTYTGFSSTGINKFIPINGGELVRNLKVYESDENFSERSSVHYEVSTENEFLKVSIGDYSKKRDETHRYITTYDYCLTKAQEGKNVLYLNAVGVFRDCPIPNAVVRISLPFEAERSDILCYVGGEDDETQTDGFTVDGNVITFTAPLGNMEGVTFQINSPDGALKTYFEFTPYYPVIAGFALLLLIILLKVFAFSKYSLTPVVNYTAPDNLDPLIMGKLIDNKVNGEDITSMIFYWASKGYVKINLDDKDDPTIIKVRPLPATCPDYEQVLFAGLFRASDDVKPSQLKYSFQPTAARATALVNAKAKGLYNNMTIGLSIIFALLGGILLGVTPFLLALTQISSSYMVLYDFLAIVPVLLVYGLSETVMYYRLKFKKITLCLAGAGILALCAAFSALYCFLTPSLIMPTAAKALLCVATSGITIGSVLIMCRTEKYTKQLNDIVGFRNYILLTEKAQLELMLESDPQFYYKILPYAQVLNVSDKWENKFADLTVQSPDWVTGSFAEEMLRFSVINSMIKHSVLRLTPALVARPVSAGGGVGSGRSGHGGFDGGHVGGGHGGGGFGGR